VENVGMDERLPDKLMSTDGRYAWCAYRPDGGRFEQDDSWQGPPEGSLIRLMSEDTVDVPLWSEDGLIFADDEELIREWDVSQELAADIARWGRASQHPPTAEQDAEAAWLIRRLRHELGERFRFAYRP
jgi:hypothetical protein